MYQIQILNRRRLYLARLDDFISSNSLYCYSQKKRLKVSRKTSDIAKFIFSTWKKIVSEIPSRPPLTTCSRTRIVEGEVVGFVERGAEGRFPRSRRAKRNESSAWKRLSDRSLTYGLGLSGARRQRTRVKMGPSPVLVDSLSRGNVSLALVAWHINSLFPGPGRHGGSLAVAHVAATWTKGGYTYIRSHHGFAGTKQTRHKPATASSPGSCCSSRLFGWREREDAFRTTATND